jgi:large subunit ribosomal protein L14e
MSLFKKYVEVGRVVRMHEGRYAGQLGVIVDVIDQSRVLLNGPTMKRHIAPFKHIVLTPIVAKKVTKNARRAHLVKALKADNIVEKFNNLDGVKRQAIAKKRRSLSDFDRFKVMVARKHRALKVRQQVNKLKAAAKAAKPKPAAKK